MNSRLPACRVPRSRRGASHFAVVSIALVALIVAMVSLPRLRELGLRENAADAERVLRRAAELLRTPGQEGTLQELVARDRILARSLADGEWLDVDRLRCHGYLFERVRMGELHGLRAWPWQYASTGLACYALWRGTGNELDGRVLWNPNERGQASGPGNPPATGEPGWRALD
jgi:hypothetical protein